MQTKIVLSIITLGFSGWVLAEGVVKNGGSWPVIVVEPKAAETLPKDVYKNIGTLNGKDVFINVVGKANDPVIGSDGSDPEPGGGVDRVRGILTISPVGKANDPVTGSDGSDPEPGGGVDRVLGTINLSTAPEDTHLTLKERSGVILLDYVGKANDPVTGTDGSDPEPGGGVDSFAGNIYSAQDISKALGKISLDMQTIRSLTLNK